MDVNVSSGHIHGGGGAAEGATVYLNLRSRGQMERSLTQNRERTESSATFDGMEEHLFLASEMAGISFSHHERKRLGRSFVTATRDGRSAAQCVQAQY